MIEGQNCAPGHLWDENDGISSMRIWRPIRKRLHSRFVYRPTMQRYSVDANEIDLHKLTILWDIFRLTFVIASYRMYKIVAEWVGEYRLCGF